MLYLCIQFNHNRTIKGLQEDDLNDEFFSKVIGTRGTLVDWKPMEVRIMKVLWYLYADK